jgi:hypothetical protein
MNDASAVMKEWRRLQIVSASAAVVSVPDRVQQLSQSALSALWTEAQEFAVSEKRGQRRLCSVMHTPFQIQTVGSVLVPRRNIAA